MAAWAVSGGDRVDDLVHDAYACLMEAHATGPIACPRALLFVTARNLALNHLRH